MSKTHLISNKLLGTASLNLKYNRKARARRFARAISMCKKSSKVVEALKTKGKMAKTAPKGCEKRVFRAFSTEYLFKNAKKSGIYTLISHKYPILVRSTGICPLGRASSLASFCAVPDY